ncbi:hypothetical protein D6C95_05500 [Aureobasidium pullulans]|nr:hypothetical protein D6C95_05500 [Aureobasidium pullulans]
MEDTASSDAETKAALNRDRAIYESGANQANVCKHKREALPCATVNEIMLRLADLVTSDHEFLTAKFEHHVKKDSESNLQIKEFYEKETKKQEIQKWIKREEIN